MPKTKATASPAVRCAIVRNRVQRALERRRLQPKRAVTLVLAAALSVGGVAHAFDDVHFLVKKDLDSLQVLRQDGGERTVVAQVDGAFTSNSLYKIARALPASLVTEQKNFFDIGLLRQPDDPRSLTQKLSLIRDDVRRDFFAAKVPFGELIHEKARKYDVDPALVAAVVETESRFQHHATSQRGAQGLMQLMPKTGRWMGARNLYDPDQNVEAGVKYLKYLQNRFDGNLKNTIAAYNAGEGNVLRYGGVPPYRETQGYVRKVMKNYEKRNAQLKSYGSSVSSPDLTVDVPAEPAPETRASLR